MTKTLDAWTEGYLSFLLDVGKKGARTIIDVRCTLRRVLRIMKQFYPGKPLWTLALPQFLRWMNFEREQGRSIRSLAKDLSHVRGFLGYAWRSGRCDRNVLDGFCLQDAKPEPVIPIHLELAEVRAMIEACPRKTRQERRNRLIILLLYGCGLRTAELCQLDVGDVDLERQELMIRYGKGLRERRIPVPDGVWTELLVCLADRAGKMGPLVRTVTKQRRMKGGHICQVVREAAQRARLPRPVFPKTLRHTFATHLIDRGVDVAVISMLMGHRSPRETGVYLHVLNGKKEAAVARLPLERST